jgi:hypothetical protein
MMGARFLNCFGNSLRLYSKNFSGHVIIGAKESKGLEVKHLDEYRIVYKNHARIRMIQRNISEDEIVHTIKCGTIIKEYPDDTPFPSVLLLCWYGVRPVHVVVAIDNVEKIQFIVIAYEPNPDEWEENFKRRKR